ncbi:MAG: dienelactone hydrolase family protein [Desulfobaccales bacterium]
MKYLLALILALALTGGAQAKIVTKTVEYNQNGTVLKGYLAYDDAVKGTRPGVLVVPEWWGLNDFAKMQARRLAEMGYVALAADMYGQGMVAKDPQEAARLAGQVRGTPLMRPRVQAAFQQLRQNKLADPKRLAAIGFCFGGTAVLELAYSGTDLAGIVSFHGGLIPLKAEDAKGIKAKFLVLHGADDPHEKPEEIAAFQEGLRKAGADWQMLYYGDAVHAFTNPDAGADKSKGVAYNAKAAARSWKHMQLFFQEIFSRSS